jgi:folate-binding protein YgfZ
MNQSDPILHTLPDRAVISVSGPDARSLLQRVITADVETLADGEARPGALLAPQGKIIADFLIFADHDALLLDVFAEAAETLAKRLNMFRLRADAKITRRADLTPVWSTDLFGGSAPDPRLASQIQRGFVASEETDATPSDGLMALEIAEGVPVFGRDYGEAEIFPTDVNLDVYGGVGWTKGCFIGQEVVSRMKRRGTIRKRSLATEFEAEAPAVGTSLMAGTSTIGTITSICGHHAVSMVRLDRLAAATDGVTADGYTAIVHLPDALKPEPAAGKI